MVLITASSQMHHGITNRRQYDYLFDSLTTIETLELPITGPFLKGIHWWLVDSPDKDQWWG